MKINLHRLWFIFRPAAIWAGALGIASTIIALTHIRWGFDTLMVIVGVIFVAFLSMHWGAMLIDHLTQRAAQYDEYKQNYCQHSKKAR